MGSAHVGFADGREAVVGVRCEVERTPSQFSDMGNQEEVDTEMAGTEQTGSKRGKGRARWVSLSLTLPGLRDDDSDLVFLEEMLSEVLVAPSTSIGTARDINVEGECSLQDALAINTRWHWRLYIDVVLISPPEGAARGSYPLPLLSMAIHLALRDTRVPRLKSEGEEDPLADDDWEASLPLYPRVGNGKSVKAGLANGLPPVTLLVMVVGENVIFDPSGVELGVADGVFAVSVGRTSHEAEQVKILAVRMLETNARDTFRGVPRVEGTNEWDIVPGVWKPKIGGVKRAVLMKVLKAVVGDLGREVMAGLEAFLVHEG